jgi:hypothetical protein
MRSPFYTILPSGSIVRFTPTSAPLLHRCLLHHPLGAACRFGGAHIRASTALTPMIAGDHPRTPPLSTSSQLPVPLVHDVPRALVCHAGQRISCRLLHIYGAHPHRLWPACGRAAWHRLLRCGCAGLRPAAAHGARAELDVDHDDILPGRSDADGSESEGRVTTLSAAHDPRALPPKEPRPVPIHVLDELQVSHEVDALPATRRERRWRPRSPFDTSSLSSRAPTP